MQIRKYIYALIIGIAIFSGVQYFNAPTPNQQIVIKSNVQAQNGKVLHADNLKQIQHTLSDFGIRQIHVTALGNGSYQLNYKSNASVAVIKKALAQLAIFKTSTPQNTVNFNFDVFEIKSGVPIQNGFDGYLVYNANPKSDRVSQIVPSHLLGLQPALSLELRFSKPLIVPFTSFIVYTANTNPKAPIRAGPIV